MAYKPQQGRMARTAAFWSAAVLGLYGCHTLHQEVSSRVASLAEPLGGIVIPIVTIDLSISFLIASAAFIGWFIGLYYWLDRPKNADLLIETEAELRKVTWPTVQDATSSSLVVIFTVVFLMVYMGLADRMLSTLVGRYILKLES